MSFDPRFFLDEEIQPYNKPLPTPKNPTIKGETIAILMIAAAIVGLGLAFWFLPSAIGLH